MGIGLIGLAAGLTIGIGSIGPLIGLVLAIQGYYKAMSINTKLCETKGMQNILLVSFALIETIAIYCLVISLLLVLR